jgi:hypothetical protein
MLREKVIEAMRQRGILTIKYLDKDGNAHFDIDFKKAEEHFPQFIEEMVLLNLGDYDREVYELGYMAYTILPDGTLQWKPTQKLNAIIDACRNTHLT